MRCQVEWIYFLWNDSGTKSKFVSRPLSPIYIYFTNFILWESSMSTYWSVQTNPSTQVLQVTLIKGIYNIKQVITKIVILITEDLWNSFLWLILQTLKWVSLLKSKSKNGQELKRKPLLIVNWMIWYNWLKRSLSDVLCFSRLNKFFTSVITLLKKNRCDKSLSGRVILDFANAMSKI